MNFLDCYTGLRFANVYVPLIFAICSFETDRTADEDERTARICEHAGDFAFQKGCASVSPSCERTFGHLGARGPGFRLCFRR